MLIALLDAIDISLSILEAYIIINNYFAYSSSYIFYILFSLFCRKLIIPKL